MTRTDCEPECTGTGRLTRALVAVVAIMAIVLTGCGGGEKSDESADSGEIVITCGSCGGSPTDPSLQNAHEIAKLFNEKYRGRYRVTIVKNQYAGSSPERLQYYQRLALADDLPDVFQINIAELRSLARTGKLANWAPILEKRPEWKARFHGGAFDAVTGEGGEIWAIPQTRDAIGIYWNRAIFREAGVGTFPRTWDEVEQACEKIAAIGKRCFAMDGDWTTLLMWANLIGTAPDGKAFLDEGIREGDYSEVPSVVRATETLKGWHTSGFTNDDAFSGDYQNAATAFIRGQAAMIANGPWMVNSDIKTKNAIRGLYENVGYEASPGWSDEGQGLIVVAGEGSFASGAKDERKQEAVAAFLDFFGEHDQAFHQIVVEGAYPAVRFDPTPAERRKLEPLGLELNERASTVPVTYPHPYANAPAPFQNAFKNLWPAYVKGELSTQEFLSRLAEDSQSATG